MICGKNGEAMFYQSFLSQNTLNDLNSITNWIVLDIAKVELLRLLMVHILHTSFSNYLINPQNLLNFYVLSK